MNAATARGPKPWRQRRVSTTFLRVPRVDWLDVKHGAKTEFRAGTGKNAVPQLWGVTTPTLVVGYSIDTVGRHDGALLRLEAMWQEPLGAIGPESLTREGFRDLAEFRAYWIARERRRFAPTRLVFCYRVRPAAHGDIAEFKEALVEHLYGDFLAVAA